MPNDEPKTHPDWEGARASIAVKGAPPITDGTTWDKPAPTEPPNPKKLEIPQHLEKIVQFFHGIVMDESLLIDLCLERCMKIVERNVLSKTFGIDSWSSDGQGAGGSQFTPVQYAAVAGPMTVELYKQVLIAVEQRRAEYDRLYDEMTREREKNSPGGPRIIVPGA